MKGTIDSFFIKKKQLVDAQYQACKVEINFQDLLNKLREQLESCKKELKEERICTKQLKVSLSQHQTELDKRFKEIRGLKDQAHQSRKDIDKLQQEATHWEMNNHYLQVLLD